MSREHIDIFIAARRCGRSVAFLSTLLELEERGWTSAGDLARLHRVDYRAELMMLNRFVNLGFLDAVRDLEPHRYNISEKGCMVLSSLRDEVAKVKQTRENYVFHQ